MKLPSPSSAEAVVAIIDLSRQFGAKIVLKDISLRSTRQCIRVGRRKRRQNHFNQAYSRFVAGRNRNGARVWP